MDNLTKLLKLAWRNIWRNRRRTFITMGAIIFAVVIITLSDALQNGTYDQMEEYAVRLFSGDLQIHRTTYQEEQAVSLSLENSEQDWEQLLNQPWVTQYSKRLKNFGLVTSDSSSAGALIMGIEPEKEPEVTTFANKIVSGKALTEGDFDQVLLGETMAKNLNITLGDSVVVISQGYQGSMSYGLYAVKGLIKTGSIEFDRNLMIMTLGTAQELFWMPERFNELVVVTNDFRSAPAYAKQLQEKLPAENYEVLDWNSMMPEINQSRSLDDIGNYIFYVFLLIIVGFEIFNTATMSVLERTREFGVLQAIGMKPYQVSLLVFMELMLKVVIALIVSFIVAFLILTAIGDAVIPLSPELKDMYDDMGFYIEGLGFARRPGIFIFPLVSVAIIAFLTSFYPAFRVYQYTPVEALSRH